MPANLWTDSEAANYRGSAVAKGEGYRQRHGKRQSMKAEVEHAPGTGAWRHGFTIAELLLKAVNAGAPIADSRFATVTNIEPMPGVAASLEGRLFADPSLPSRGDFFLPRIIWKLRTRPETLAWQKLRKSAGAENQTEIKQGPGRSDLRTDAIQGPVRIKIMRKCRLTF